MELQGRMRHLQQSIGPPIGPDGRPMMMGPNGPMPRPPPNHPIMMEMQALDQHLRGLHQQPQSPETQQKVSHCDSSQPAVFSPLSSSDPRAAGQNAESAEHSCSAVGSARWSSPARHDGPGTPRTAPNDGAGGTWGTSRSTWPSSSHGTSATSVSGRQADSQIFVVK